MLLFAAAAATTTGLEKVQKIPTDVWIKIAFGILAFIVAIILLRKLAHVNKAILIAVTFVVVVVGGFKWIYERDEPAFMTPVINKIAPFFPEKDSYSKVQATIPGQKTAKPTPTPTSRPKR